MGSCVGSLPHRAVLRMVTAPSCRKQVEQERRHCHITSADVLSPEISQHKYLEKGDGQRLFQQDGSLNPEREGGSLKKYCNMVQLFKYGLWLYTGEAADDSHWGQVEQLQSHRLKKLYCLCKK